MRKPMSVRRLTITTGLVVLCALGGAQAFAGAPALGATILHRYLSQLTGFAEPVGVTVAAGGDVYVADSQSRVVDRFNSSGAPLNFSATETYIKGSQLTGTPSGPFEEPGGVAVNESTGNVYVSDRQSVDIFNSSGEYLSQSNGDFEGLFIDQSTGDLYTSKRFGSAVEVFNSAGEYLRQFGSGTLSRTFGQSVAVNDSTGNAYVGNLEPKVVDVFNSTGIFLSPAWTGVGTPSKSFRGFLYLGLDQSNGHVYVANSEKGVVDELGPSTSEEYLGQSTGTPSGNFTEPVAVAVSPSTGYLYVADKRSASSGVVDVFGPDVTVLPPAVNDRTPAVSGVTRTSALVSGTVNTGNGATAYHVAYADAAGYMPGAANPYENGGSTQELNLAPGVVDEAVERISLTGLLAGTTYHYALVATNPAGTTVGPDYTFTTADRIPPLVSTGEAGGVGQTSATISGTVGPQGLQTSYEFDLGADTSYSGARIFGNAGQSANTETITLNLQNLIPGRTYHYRIAATNEDGIAYGADQSFTTPGVPSPLAQPLAAPLIATPSIAFPTETGTAGKPPAHKKKSNKNSKHKAKKHSKKTKRGRKR